jgi:hypothetical protein
MGQERRSVRPEPEDTGSARLERAALFPVLVGMAMAAVKAGFAVLSGSVGLPAEAVHPSAAPRRQAPCWADSRSLVHLVGVNDRGGVSEAHHR